MQRMPPSQPENYARRRHRRRIWQKIVGCLACIVVFCTTYALILPAITMEETAYCGVEEHQHSAECYTRKLVCPLSEGETAGHIHTEECYQTERVLTCTQEESPGHTHTEECRQMEEILICDLPEDENHTHDEACCTQQITYRCGLEESEGHIHTEECYQEVRKLICGREESQAHVHTESCYEEVLTCGKEEHTHSLSCYSDPSADVETAAVWERTLPETLTGDWSEDLLTVAQSQLGYTESSRNYAVTEDGEKKGYTRYGDWYGNLYGDWCAMFVSFCLNYAEIPREAIPYEAGCQQWIETLEKEEYDLYRKAEDYTPVPGDLIFFNWDEEPDSDHVGIVAEVIPATEDTPAQVKTIEGNASNQVKYGTYELTDQQIMGYAQMPEEPEDSEQTENPMDIQKEEPAETEVITTSPTQIPVSTECIYEDDNISVKLHIEGMAVLPEEDTAEKDDAEIHPQTLTDDEDAGENASEEEPVQDVALEEPVLTVTELSEDTAEYQSLVGYAQESSGEDTFFDLSAMSYALRYQGQELDISGCDVTAEITPKTALLEAAEPAYDTEEEIAPEAEIGVVLTALQDGEEETVELDSTLIAADEEQAETAAVLTVELDSGNPVLAVSVSQTANPRFTVQYYAWLDVVADSGSDTDSLPVIDTSGCNLPQNGTVPNTKSIYLTAAENGKYEVATVSQLTEVYQEHNYQYITAPNLTYFNRLYENGNYTLKEIWVLKAEANDASTDANDWNIYQRDQIHFTNREASVNDTTVLITDNTVIRLVFDTTASGYTNAVNFYDYDITEDGTHTASKGINNPSNYTGSGSILAFGNKNTDTGLGEVLWVKNTLNKYNSNGYSGCTFKLAAGLSDGKIQYSSGVAAPKLFNDGSAIGKTSYDSGQYSLSFSRVGDTYTLSSVNGAGLTGLEYFNHPKCGNTTYTTIWTNNFWPMDSVTNQDPHTGTYGSTGTYIGASGTTKSYPPSDDGLPHNNMFGMQYAVQFTLTEDYSGPLEYYFFGDDDMWVFLDSQLVCDIGGVHSSVGEYVNLWDYISKGSSGTHTLTFFYTERGLSGSSCYMQFTLPSVSSVTPEQNTGLLRVEKQVTGYQAESNDTEYRFEIKFTDDAGHNLPDDYSYTRYDNIGNVIKQDVIIFDGGSFELRNGEYVIINYLPYGTKYTITETGDLSGYIVTSTVDGKQNSGVTATGQIGQGSNGTVVYTNNAGYELPSTGGTGTTLYTIGGLLLMSGAGILLLYQKKKRRKEDLISS